MGVALFEDVCGFHVDRCLNGCHAMERVISCRLVQKDCNPTMVSVVMNVAMIAFSDSGGNSKIYSIKLQCRISNAVFATRSLKLGCRGLA